MAFYQPYSNSFGFFGPAIPQQSSGSSSVATTARRSSQGHVQRYNIFPTYSVPLSDSEWPPISDSMVRQYALIADEMPNSIARGCNASSAKSGQQRRPSISSAPPGAGGSLLSRPVATTARDGEYVRRVTALKHLEKGEKFAAEGRGPEAQAQLRKAKHYNNPQCLCFASGGPACPVVR